MTDPRRDRERFETIFEQCSGSVLAYARRHSDASSAEDVAAETFLIAWRRRDDIPSNPLPWLLVVARNVLANRRRSTIRSEHIHAEIAALGQLAARQVDVEGQVIDRSTMLGALAALTSLEREAVLLIAWDGLAIRDAARVAGCTVRAFKVRVHRARNRLSREIAVSESARDATVATTPDTVLERKS